MNLVSELKKLGEFYKQSNKTCVCVSGGFDPLHVGHLELILGGSVLADELVVLVNDDNFLLNKKGYVFMPQIERLQTILSIKGVSQAYLWEGTYVDKALEALKPDIFYNGGDRQEVVPIEKEVCDRLGIKLMFGPGKVQSSSNLCETFYKNMLKARFRQC